MNAITDHTHLERPAIRHPDTGETWTGRGLRPVWINAAIAGGKALDDFSVKADKPRPVPKATLSAAPADPFRA